MHPARSSNRPNLHGEGYGTCRKGGLRPANDGNVQRHCIQVGLTCFSLEGAQLTTLVYSASNPNQRSRDAYGADGVRKLDGLALTRTALAFASLLQPVY